MTTPPLRLQGQPSPIEAGTHEVADAMAGPFMFDPALAGSPELPVSSEHLSAMFELPEGSPGWLVQGARLIRPLCVGALMAIPTVGAATVGLVAAFDERRGMAMVRVSTSFLQGVPTEIVLLIGALATGYGFAKTIETLRGRRAP